MNSIVQDILQGKDITFSDAHEELKRSFPLLSQMEKTPQDSIWHAEGNVAIHTNMVIQEAQKLMPTPNEDRLVLVIAALFHDIGKPLCTREYSLDGITRIGSSNHAKIGANYLTPIISRLGIEQELSNRIINIVRYHHHPRKIYKDTTEKSLWEFIQIPNHQEILLFEKADLLGRSYEHIAQELEIVDLVSTLTKEKTKELNITSTIENEFTSKPKNWKEFVEQKTKKLLTTGLCSHPWEAISKAQNTPEVSPTVTLLCGSPRSGKTTYRNQHNDKTIISLDELRIQITGKKDCFKKEGQVIQEAYKQFKSALANHQHIIWDSTNTTASLRKKVLGIAENYGAQTTIVCFIVDPNEVNQRNQKSTEQVPSHVIEKFFKNWELPTPTEAHRIEYIYG